MTKKMAGRNWDNLITSLVEHKTQFESANYSLRVCIDNFCKLLKEDKVRHSDLDADAFWGYKSLMKCFTDEFDPTLLKLFPTKSSAHEVLFANGITLPLSKTLVKKESYQEHAIKIKKSVDDLENILSSPEWLSKNKNLNIENSTLFKDAENLELFGSILHSICIELNTNEELTWCSICFRRSTNYSSHCHLHLSTEDTSYRKGKRLQKSIPNDLLEAIKKNRAKRNILGENFYLYSNENDLPEKLSHQINGIVVNETIKDLVFYTQNNCWSKSLKKWELLIKLLPNVRSRLNKRLREFNNWNEFVLALTTSLDNLNEETKHPYWIFLMIVEADNWLAHEDNFKDERFTETKYMIISLIKEGFNNSQIAKKVGVTRQYVGQVKAIFT